MQISSIIIEGLFGLYSYNVNFRSHEGDVSIITGPNGYGKTTILTIINSLESSNLYYFYELKFDSIYINLDDGSHLEIVRKENISAATKDDFDKRQERISSVRISWYDANGVEISFIEYNPSNISKVLREYDYRFSFNFDKLDNNARNKKYTREFNEFIAHANGQDQFLMQIEGIHSTFIHSNRIYNEAREKNEQLPVENVKRKLFDLLRDEKNKYLIQSQRIDNEFIHQVISNEVKRYTAEEYKQLVADVSEKMTKLSQYQLVDKVELPMYNEENSSAVCAYVVGLQTKYAVYDSLLAKLDLYNKLLRSKKFTNKYFLFSPMHGFRVMSITGDEINVCKLSSGEQNEIVMLFSLIFEVPDKTILLIDEPENSLHVVWQQMFVQDIEQISQIKNLQTIIATHSISIASKGRNYTTDLYYLQKHE